MNNKANSVAVIHSRPWQLSCIWALFLAVGIELLASIVFIPMALQGNADFRQLYAGSLIVCSGKGRNLYDAELERRVENREVSELPGVLPTNHPAYEYALLAPLTILSYRNAYLLWTAINVAVIAYCVIRLSAKIHESSNHGLVAAAIAVGFSPVWMTLAQGQDAAWVLLLFVLANESHSEVRTGVLMGLTAFRFHILIPVLLVYILWRRWRVLGGAALAVLFLAFASILITGLPASFQYVKSLIPTSEVRQFSTANALGLFQVIFGNKSVTASVLALGLALVILWRVSKKKPSVSTALLVLPFVSVHLLVHDLIVLLIPITEMFVSSLAPVNWMLSIMGMFPMTSGLTAIATPLMIRDCE